MSEKVELKAKKVMEWTCGTLKYNWKSLTKVWFFSMLGTLALNLMVYSLVPSLMPRILDHWKIDALRISLIMSTIPQILNMCINPVLSTWSDKVRSRWGRRIPFVVISAPLLVLMMMLIGYHESLVPAFQKMTGWEMTEAAFWILCIITVVYQIFYLVPGAIQCYVAPDVIPKSFIGTYYGVVSLFGNLMGFAFNLWILPRADVAPKFWFGVIGVFYLVSMALQFLFVKEGKYPPNEKHEGGNVFVVIWKYVAAYAYECWSQPIYLCIFVASGVTAASTLVRSTFNVLFATNELGLTMTQYGQVFAYTSLVGAIISIPVGLIMDKKCHPLIIYFLSGVAVVIFNAWAYYYIKDYKTFYVAGVVIAVTYVVQNAASTPLLLRVVPNEKFGQFGSAGAIINCIICAVAGGVGGWLTKLYGYRMIFIWDFAVTLLSLVFMVMLWFMIKSNEKANGGKYIPPRPWLHGAKLINTND
ncbi:MAG: MFS transporter [Lentisphaeria bacterium]|nr:MFS transporter [Lentisphaeria bacterium]